MTFFSTTTSPSGRAMWPRIEIGFEAATLFALCCAACRFFSAFVRFGFFALRRLFSFFAGRLSFVALLGISRSRTRGDAVLAAAEPATAIRATAVCSFTE